MLYVNKGTLISGRSLPGAPCCFLPEEGNPCDSNQFSPISFACPLILGNQNIAFHSLRDGGLGTGVTELGAGDKAKEMFLSFQSILCFGVPDSPVF